MVFDSEQESLLHNLYNNYNNVIKPLIAVYEAREARLPTPLFNEIRAFNHFHVCYKSIIE